MDTHIANIHEMTKKNTKQTTTLHTPHPRKLRLQEINPKS